MSPPNNQLSSIDKKQKTYNSIPRAADGKMTESVKEAMTLLFAKYEVGSVKKKTNG